MWSWIQGCYRQLHQFLMLDRRRRGWVALWTRSNTRERVHELYVPCHFYPTLFTWLDAQQRENRIHNFLYNADNGTNSAEYIRMTLSVLLSALETLYAVQSLPENRQVTLGLSPWQRLCCRIWFLAQVLRAESRGCCSEFIDCEELQEIKAA
jgi:hypothetical protein